MIEVVNAGFIKALRSYSNRVHQWAAPLTEHQFWSRPFPYGNSFGQLVLHLTGNLNFYLGASILNTGYVRNREWEFTDPNPPTKSKALASFDASIEIAVKAVESQTADQWATAYQAAGEVP